MKHVHRSVVGARTGAASFSQQAMHKVASGNRPASCEEIQVVAGRHCELLVLKLSCTFALSQHCSAAHFQLAEELQVKAKESDSMVAFLHEGSRAACMSDILKKLGHPFCAKFLFQFREDSKPSSNPSSKSIPKVVTNRSSSSKTSSKAKDGTSKRCFSKLKFARKSQSSKGSCSGSDQDESSDDNNEKIISVSKAVKAVLKPFMKTLVTKDELAGMATKADLQDAILQARRHAVPDAAAGVGQAMSDATEKAEKKIAEVAEHAISKMNSNVPDSKTKSKEIKKKKDTNKKRKIVPGCSSAQIGHCPAVCVTSS